MASVNMKIIKLVLRFISRLFIVRKIRSEAIYFTFDDGPHKENTEKILSLLEKYNFKASFFLVGQQVEQYPHIVQKIYQQGHSLGYHSYSHVNAKKSNFISIWKDLKKAKTLENKYQISFNRRYRPPYGSLTISSVIILLLNGWKIYLWSLDSLDSYIDSDKVVQTLAPEKTSTGDIILMHDDYDSNTNVLEQLLIRYKSTNISLAAIQ